MTKAKFFIILIIAIVVIGGGVLIFLRGDEDTWICQNNQWIKHGKPSAPMPVTPCGNQTTNTNTHAEKITVTSPLPNANVISPLEISGQAIGPWYFEASFPVKLLDASGKTLAQTPAQAQGEWMTNNFVPFKATLTFDVSKDTPATLVLQKDNPSGLPQNDDSISIPLTLKAQELTTVKIYFTTPTTGSGPNFDCGEVAAVQRQVPKTQAIARAALEQLLAGPTDQEKLQGFGTTINSGVKIQSLTIVNGVAKADFDEQLQYQVGGSCRIAAIRSQITNTLKQFPTVKTVIISIDGRTEDILQP